MMPKRNKLHELLALAENSRKLKISDRIRRTIELEHLHLTSMLQRGMRIYGTNTAVGHRDDSVLQENRDLWSQIVDSHLIGKGPPYSRFQARCIGLSKLMHWSAGKSGVSTALFQHITNVLADSDFSPSIPSGESYSSGDVIPATHWAVAVLKGTKNISPFSGAAEPMPLINGSFVHVGLAAACIPSFDKSYNLWLANTEIILSKILLNNSFLYYHKAHAASSSSRWISEIKLNASPFLGPQDSVSVRASLDVAEVLRQTRDNLGSTLSLALSRPSSNPLIDNKHDFPISQASFLEPGLVIAQSALIEAILLAMWTSVSRVQYLLSGKLQGIPIDGGGRGLGAIQKPKRMLAILEHARLKTGRRVFSSGGSASNGIEDLWTYGTFVSELKADLCNMFQDCCEIEAAILDELSK